MTDSSNSDDFFPPWFLSRVQSVLHFILFTQQKFSEPLPWARDITRSENTVDKVGLVLLFERIRGRWLASSLTFALLCPQPSLCLAHRRHSAFVPGMCVTLKPYVLCISCTYMNTRFYSTDTTIGVPSMWLSKQWLNKSINETILMKIGSSLLISTIVPNISDFSQGSSPSTETCWEIPSRSVQK